MSTSPLTQEVIGQHNEYVMQNYTRKDVVIVKGRGSWVWDANKKMYLDFFPGWAVSGIGHCHPRVVKAISEQAKKILHVPNNYYNELQGQLAMKISLNSFGGRVFFCNSGAEANEGAIKLVRAFGNPDRNEIITMEGSFHGRTLACTAATGQQKYQKGFEPLPPGFTHVPFNDKEALKQAVSDRTVAVMLELIQGEGGVRIATPEYVRYVRELCYERNMLMIVDEVQTGMGRTGKYFAYQNYGIEPDVMTLAKSLGGGVPIGALVMQNKVSGILGPGMHASTFGGNPLACAAGLAVFEAIERERLLANVETMGAYLMERLQDLKKEFPVIREVRGRGLMFGLDLITNAPKAYEFCLSNGLLINCTQGNVLRIMPALNVAKQEINQALPVLREALARC
ncbi:MAG: aspartate aminotransferase family protein [Candidatus Omnitrophica bacterium]|nr:aspartate aminotransferase family protein [Candidatus Omnitrophota bacterium]